MIAQYQGLNVNELDALRKELREKVFIQNTKNRITKIALKETSKDLENILLTYSSSNILWSYIDCKILTKFSKSNNKLKIIAGLDGKVLVERCCQKLWVF